MGLKELRLSDYLKAVLLLALSVVLTRFMAVVIPLGGLPTLRVGFGMIPIMITGMMFGPAVGMFVGVIADLLGFMINPGGEYIWGLTLTSGLYGFLPGLVYYNLKIYRVAFNFNLINVAFIGALTAFLLYQVPIGSRLELSTVMIVIGILLIAAIYVIIPYYLNYFIKKGEKNGDNYHFDKIAFTVSFTQIVCGLFLNTYFLSTYYGASFFGFLPSRILAGIAIIPVFSMAIFGVSRILNFESKTIGKSGKSGRSM